jgi:hypothetical protein
MSETTADAPAGKTMRMVKYVGTADVREITPEEADSADIKGVDKIARWSKANGWMMPVASLPADLLRYLEDVDDGFDIVEV